MNALRSILAIALLAGVVASAAPVRGDEIIERRVYIREAGSIIQGDEFIREDGGDSIIGPQPYVPKPEPEDPIDPHGLMDLTLIWLGVL